MSELQPNRRDEHAPADPDWHRQSPALQLSRRRCAVENSRKFRARVALESARAKSCSNRLKKLRRKRRRVGSGSPEGKALQAEIDQLAPELAFRRVRCDHWRRQLADAEVLANGLEADERERLEGQWKALERLHERRPSAFRGAAERRPLAVSAPRRTPRARPAAQRPRTHSCRSTRGSPKDGDDDPGGSEPPSEPRRTGELRHISHPLEALLRDLRPPGAPPLIAYVRDPKYGLINLRLAAFLRGARP